MFMELIKFRGCLDWSPQTVEAGLPNRRSGYVGDCFRYYAGLVNKVATPLTRRGLGVRL